MSVGFSFICQNVFKHLQSEGLQEMYRTDGELECALWARQLPALAFVPVGDVVDYFEVLEQEAHEPLQPVLEYFEKYYIATLRTNGQRRTPMFPPVLWNVNHRTQEAHSRTNNSVEGWHRRFSSAITCHHPTIWKFLTTIQLEQKVTEQHYERITAGEQPPQRKRKYVALDSLLRHQIDTFEAREPLEFPDPVVLPIILPLTLLNVSRNK